MRRFESLRVRLLTGLFRLIAAVFSLQTFAGVTCIGHADPRQYREQNEVVCETNSPNPAVFVSWGAVADSSLEKDENLSECLLVSHFYADI